MNKDTRSHPNRFFSYTVEELKTKPVWSSLDAVKNDHVFIWSPDRSLYFDPIATLDQTEELAAWFTKISDKK